MNELKELIKKNRVIPFIGSGVSIPVKYKNGESIFPNWEGLLHQLKESITNEDEKNLVDAFLKLPKKDYLEIADKIEEFLPIVTFYKEIKNTFDINFEKVDKNTLSLAKAIWGLGSNLIITTNYDKVLYHACDNINKVSWDIQNIYEQAQSLSERDSKPTIWHLHGHVDNINNIILSTKKYNELYTQNEQDSKYPAALRTLRNKVSSHSLLFIGFSLDDEYFVNELNKTIEIFEGNNCPNYILCKKGSDTSKLNKNIIPIEYEDYGEPLIKKIKELSIITETSKDEIKVEAKTFTINTYNLTTLPPKNDNFIGREEELIQLEKKLSEDSMVYIVNGIGGVGKSELSYKYLHKNRQRYNNIAFIEMTNDTTIEELFLTKFKDTLQLDEHSTLDTIIQRLQNKKGKNLLLIDNIEKEEDFHKIESLNTNFDLLITTRINIDSLNILNLETLNTKDAKKLFFKFYSIEDDINDILEYLDNHPLFINLTAKALKLKYITITELRERIKNNSIEKIDSTNDKTFEEHLHDTFNKQFTKEEKKELKILLQYLSIFPSIEIDFETLDKCIKDTRLLFKLQKLVDRGWLIQKNNSYKLHQIIRTFLNTHYFVEYQKITFILENIGNFINPEDQSLIANQLTQYIPIIESIFNIYKGEEDIYTTMVLDSMTYIYYSLAQYEFSLSCQNKSLKIKQNLFGNQSIEVSQSYNLLFVLYSKKCNPKKAKEFSQLAFDIRQKELGEEHYLTIQSYLGIIDDITIDILINAKTIMINHLGETNLRVAEIYDGLGYTYLDKYKNYNDSLKYFKKSMDIRKKLLVPFHPLIADSFMALAYYHRKNNDYKNSLESLKKVLNLKKHVYESMHPEIGITYNNLATLQSEFKKSKNKIIELFEKSLFIQKDIFSEDDPNLIFIYKNLGQEFFDTAYCIKAKEHFEKVKNIIIKHNYKQDQLPIINQRLNQINKNIRKQKKAKFKDKGRYCKDI